MIVHMKRKDIYTLLFGILCCAGTSLCFSCADDLEIGKQFDESSLNSIYENRVFLADGLSGRVSNVVELYVEQYSTTVSMFLSKNASTSTSAKVMIDETYLKTYNELHNTSFEMLPADIVTLGNEGIMKVAEKGKQLDVELTFHVENQLEAGKTYALPLAIADNSSDIMIKDEENRHCVYLVKDMRAFGDAFKGEDKPKGFLFFEVNDVNPLNAFSFQLENGKYLWDVVVLFAANINYDAEAGRPYVKCNPNVQYLLDNNETLLQPLRKRGIKVLLGLLGNHDMAGLAQLSKQGAKDFAREVAQYCYAYNLDGVNYDDEYSGMPDIDNPSFVYPSTEAAARFGVGVTTSIFAFEAGKPQNGRNIIGYYIEEDGLETVKNQGRQDIKNRWQEKEDYWIAAIRDGVDVLYNTRQIINPLEHLSYQMPTAPFEIFEEDFVKTMMDYEMFKHGIDVKDFNEKIIKSVLYGSTIKENNDAVVIEFPKHAKV